jgi:hypothetical protein
MKKLLSLALMGAFALGAAAMITSCGGNAVKIEGDTITLNDIATSVTMDRFALVSQGEEFDEWEVGVRCDPERSSAIVFNQALGGFFLTPIANVDGQGIVIEGVNGVGTDFSFHIPKGTTPASYKIKIGNYILTYGYDTKEWTYSTDDNSFKAAKEIQM